MTGFEPATTRPPDVYSNRAELHPEVSLSFLEDDAKLLLFPFSATVMVHFFQYFAHLTSCGYKWVLWHSQDLRK